MFENELLSKMHEDSYLHANKLRNIVNNNIHISQNRFYIIIALFIIDFVLLFLIKNFSFKVIIITQIPFLILYYILIYTRIYYYIHTIIEKVRVIISDRDLSSHFFYIDLFYILIITILLFGSILYIDNRFIYKSLIVSDKEILSSIITFLTSITGLILTFLIFILGSILNKYPNGISRLFIGSFRIVAPVIVCIIIVFISLALLLDENYLVNIKYAFFLTFIDIISLGYIIFTTISSNNAEKLIEYCGYKGGKKISIYCRFDNETIRNIKLTLSAKGLFFIRPSENSRDSITNINQHKILVILEAFLQMINISLDNNDVELYKMSFRNLCKASKKYFDSRQKYNVYKEPILDYINDSMRVIFNKIKGQKNERLYNDYVVAIKFFASNSIQLARMNHFSKKNQSRYNQLTPNWLSLNTEVFSHTINLMYSTSASDSIETLFGCYIISVDLEDLDMLEFKYPEVYNTWFHLLTNEQTHYHYFLMNQVLSQILDVLGYSILKGSSQLTSMKLLEIFIDNYIVYDSFSSFDINHLINQLFGQLGQKFNFYFLTDYLIKNDEEDLNIRVLDKMIKLAFLLLNRYRKTYTKYDDIVLFINYLLVRINISNNKHKDAIIEQVLVKVDEYVESILDDTFDDTELIAVIIFIFLEQIDSFTERSQRLIKLIYDYIQGEKGSPSFLRLFGSFQIIYYLLKKRNPDNDQTLTISRFLKDNFILRESFYGIEDTYEVFNLPTLRHNQLFDLPIFPQYIFKDEEKIWDKYLDYKNEFTTLELIHSLIELYELEDYRIILRNRDL